MSSKLNPKNKDESVRVCVRIRPLNGKEKQDGRDYAVFADKSRGMISVKDPAADDQEPTKNFSFDAVFPPDTKQIDVYEGAATSIVEAVLDGFNGTIFAYGQTGAGKSHTMEGYNDPPELRGIIPNSFKHIFDKINDASEKQFLVRASYLEIYNEEVRDLLSKNPKNRLELKETIEAGVYVKDLTSIAVKDAAEMDHVMQAGKKNRSVGSTLMNQTSSRSHSMFCIVVECLGEGLDGQGHVCVGKLNLVDLAGSERQSKTGATGDRLKEATKINMSLSALGNVIKALVDGKSGHIPYRDSKLTRLLQDSLGGNAKTVMIANCGPADYNFDETMSTLRYANRAKNIKNKPKINEDPKDAMLREYQDEISKLKAALAAQEKGGSGGASRIMIVDGKPVAMPVEKKIVEKVVEKIVIKREGLSDAEYKELEAKATREKEKMEEKAQAEMKELLRQQNQTAEERLELERQLQQKAESKDILVKERKEMLSHLSNLESKLVVGGKIMDKAAQQEVELREAQLKLEEQRHQEMLLARELAEKDDSNMLLEEQYSSIREEVEIKTKKLKKLWAKHKAATIQLNDMKEEHRQDKEDMLETIRELKKQVKLKQFIRKNFIPYSDFERLKTRMVLDEESNEWVLQPLELEPSSLSLPRPVSLRGLRRPECAYSRNRRQFDNNARYKAENIVTLDFDNNERTTEDFDDIHMYDEVKLRMKELLANEDDELMFDSPEEDQSSSDAKRASDSGKRDKKSSSRSRKTRPGTASRSRRS